MLLRFRQFHWGPSQAPISYRHRYTIALGYRKMHAINAAFSLSDYASDSTPVIMPIRDIFTPQFRYILYQSGGVACYSRRHAYLTCLRIGSGAELP